MEGISMSKAAFIKIVILAFIISLFPTNSFCEIQTITVTVKQSFGGSQSADDARITAMAKAKREALEMAGTYVESLTVVKDSQVDKDEILALSAGVLKTEVVSEKKYGSGDAFGIDVMVKVVVDTSFLEVRVKKLLEDRKHLEQLNQARKKEKELLAKIANLEVENRILIAENKSSQDLKKQFQDASQGLTAVDWVDKALALWDINNSKYTDPHKALEYLNEAIRLKPDYEWAYNNRGCAYNDLGQHQRAIEDFNHSIRFKPDLAEAYSNRGLAYHTLGQHERAIQDYDTAIRLKPDLAEAYSNRGLAYGHEGLGQHERAIKDYDTAIRLRPGSAEAYNNRGLAYNDLRQPQRAIKDLDEAIRLRPDLVKAYHNRGIAYHLSDNIEEGCRDFKKACELGVCSGLDLVKGWGFCR